MTAVSHHPRTTTPHTAAGPHTADRRPTDPLPHGHPSPKNLVLAHLHTPGAPTLPPAQHEEKAA